MAISKSSRRRVPYLVVTALFLAVGVVVLLHYEEIHRKHLWRYIGGEPSWVTDIHWTLTSRPLKMNFKENRLDDVVGFFQDVSGLEFFIDPSVDAQNITILLKIPEMKLHGALQAVMDKTGMDYVYANQGVLVFNPDVIKNLDQVYPGYYQPPRFPE